MGAHHASSAVRDANDDRTAGAVARADDWRGSSLARGTALFHRRPIVRRPRPNCANPQTMTRKAHANDL